MKRQLRGKKEIGKMRAAQWGLIVSDTKEKKTDRYQIGQAGSTAAVSDR